MKESEPLTAVQIAEILGIEPATVRSWSRRRLMGEPVLTGPIRYTRQAAVECALAQGYAEAVERATPRRIGYCRTSTRDQDLRHQLDLLTAAGCDQIFHEQLSGKDRKRPELESALKMCRPGDTFVVTRLSRLSRSLSDLLDITRDLQDRNIDFIVTQQDINTSTAVGRFIFHVLGAVGEFERELVSENTKDGMEAAARAGSQIGALPKVDEEQHQEIIDRYAAGEAVRDIAARYGLSRQTVYNYLNIPGPLNGS